MIKQQNTKRSISFILALAFLVGSFSFSAVATEMEEEYIPYNDVDAEEYPPLEEYESLPNEENEFEEEGQEDMPPLFSYESITALQSVNAQLASFGSIMYPASWVSAGVVRGATVFTLTIRSNTTLAYCLEPTVPPPPAGGYAPSLLTPGTPLHHALYYMWGAPGASQLFTTANRNHTINGLSVMPNIGTIPVTGMPNQGIEYLVSTLVLAYIYADGNWNRANLNVLNTNGRAIVQWWVARLRALPRPPDANKSFSNANLSTSIEGSHQVTPWTIFQADNRNQITIPAPSGAQIQSRAGDGSWTGQWGNSVTVRGGEQVRLRSNTLTSVTGNWTSPPLQGTNNMQWLALLLDRPAGQQDIGGWDVAADPVSSITLTVNWSDPMGALQIRKISERGGEFTGGIRFRVEGVENHNNHINQIVTTQAGSTGGWVNVSNIPTGRYRITELDQGNRPWYQYAPPQFVTVTAGSNPATHQVTFYNNFRLGALQIRKISERGAAYGGNIRFRVQGVDAHNSHIDRTVTTIQGNGGGWVNVSPIPTGRYRITELDIPPFYRPQPPQYVTVTEGNNPAQHQITFYNNFRLGALQIRKISERGAAYGGNIRFHVQGVDDWNNHIDRTVTTAQGNGGGWVNVSQIPIGRYRVTELDIPPFYRPQETQYVTVAEGNNPAQFQVTFYNELRRGLLRVFKTSERGNVPANIQGIQFRVQGVDTINRNIDVVITTNAQGIATAQNLILGRYRVTELNVGAPYQDQPPQYVTVTSENATAYFVRFHNELRRGRVVGLKIAVDEWPPFNR